MLSDRGILAALKDGAIDVEPFDPANLQPASIDLTMHPEVRFPRKALRTPWGAMDLANVPFGHTELQGPGYGGFIALGAGEQLLACTAETVRLGRMHVARVEGKSSLARLFLAVHVTGGFIDPGFEGQITLEVVNLSPWTIYLHPGMPICQIAFDRLDTTPSRGYAASGRYQSQSGPTESRYTIT